MTDTSLRRTLSAGPEGVSVKESWLYFIYLWKCNSVQFDFPTFLSYNKVMLSQEMLFGNEVQKDLAACWVNPLFLHKVCEAFEDHF